MSALEAIYSAGFLGNVIAVPVLRELAAVFLAVAISKDCRAKSNGSGALWGLFTLITPLIAGIVYFVYSRFFSDRIAQSTKEKRQAKSASRWCVLSVFTYILSIVMLIVSVVTITSAGLAGQRNGEFDFYIRYYDKNQIEYDDLNDVPLYDENGNAYRMDKASSGIFSTSYYDNQGNEYSYENCFISEEGWFYYDNSHMLTEKDDGYFYDSDGNKYAFIDDWVYWDKDGRIHLTSGKVTSDRFAFE